MRATHRRLTVGGGAGLALAGLWIGHTVEYVRVWGTAGLTRELYGSLHVYMLPLGLLIAAVASLAALRLWGVWSALGMRLDRSHVAVRTLLRGRVASVPSPLAPQAAPSFWAGVAVAWPPLALLQIALYILQENVETAAAGLPAPGLGAVTGVHALAPVVHALVALVLVVSASAVARVLRRRAAVVARIEAVARVLLRALTTRAPSIAIPESCVTRAPLQLLGAQLWQRPPPPVHATV